MKSIACAQQVLRNLIDETLQIQAAKAAEITITDADIDKTVARVAANVKQTPEQMADYLKAGAPRSARSAARSKAKSPGAGCSAPKIESGQRRRRRSASRSSTGSNASKGTEEFRVGEIFLSANTRQ